MKKETFKHYNNQPVWFAISAILTSTLSFLFFYDYFIERTYYKNRKLLIKLLKSNELKWIEVGRQVFENDRVISYVFEYQGKKYEIWKFNNKEISLNQAIQDVIDNGVNIEQNDLIGLFMGSIQAKIQVRKIIKLLNKVKCI
jgi:hypothetical protein